MRVWILAVALASALLPAVSRGEPPQDLLLIYTSDVRGTVGICG